MDLMHANIVIIGLIIMTVLLLAAFLFRIFSKEKYKYGTKAANTARIKETVLYKMLNTGYFLLKAVMIIGFAGSIIAALFLAARPYKTSDETNGVRKRDIILCMDVSFSLYDQNLEIADYLKELVAGLEGDRFGICIFNASSVTYVPLTDDYDYVIERLDDLKEYFSMQKEYMEVYANMYEDPDSVTDKMQEDCSELETKILYFDVGTRYNDSKGSSLIGEGLASSLYSFPYLDDSERTRVIIMSTDNQLNSTEEMVSLPDAAAYCSKYKVTMFGIFPSEENFYDDGYDYTGCLDEFRSAAEKTGGKCYIRTESQPVSEIVQDIQKQEAMIVNLITTKQVIDLPKLPFIFLIISLSFGSLAGVILRK